MDERVSTGVLNIDSLIAGGIPKGFTVMVAGNSGTGKTTLCSQFIYKGLTLQPSENGVYISFSESKKQFYSNSKKIGMDFEKYENQLKFQFLDFVSISNEGLQEAFEEILASIKSVKSQRLVLDSFSALFMSFQNKIEARIALQVFLGKIVREEGITSLIISEIPYGLDNLGQGIEESVADGIIKLEHGPDNASPVFLKVVKMRGTSINREKHVCMISDEGFKLYPKHKIMMNLPVSNERISSGITNFDGRIGNGKKGLVKGTISAIVGASGSGKTTFALQFVTNGTKGNNNESGLFCSLEDSKDEILRITRGFDFNTSPPAAVIESGNDGRHGIGGDGDVGEVGDVGEEQEYDNGQNNSKNDNKFEIITFNHSNYNPDAFIEALEREIKAKKPTRLSIDGLSVYELKYKNEMHSIIERITSLVGKYQITTLVTLLGAQKNIFQATDMNLSPLFQNIILLRFVELYGRMRRVLMILKISMSHQDGAILEFKISTEKGFEIVGPIGNEFTGIFSGIARK
ncbi:MAG: AAA family ATPase [Candidatus Nitrosocosmicus sp.]|nr:AAA family ATPase [Candidatus Nitrosocosmicus sp.]MDN5868515.1 AAA family ATPase [Candidatus Nitrosocosmicus sp.]